MSAPKGLQACALLLLLLLPPLQADLVVNVRNQGGEVYQEAIVSNVSDDTISLSFKSPGDGSFTNWFIDFKNEVQIVKTEVLAEEELNSLNDPSFVSYCFLTRFPKGDFIPPDAMAKLRQKNPASIRVPDRVLDGVANTTLDILLDVSWADWISPHLKRLCSSSLTYASKVELLRAYLHPSSSNNSENYLRAVRPVLTSSVECSSVRGGSGPVPCVCIHPISIPWYPCALKYCRSKNLGSSPPDSSSTFKTYRCGIHTCKATTNYLFTLNSQFNCLQ